MAQHGYNIVNQLSSQLRDDLNFALEAISSTNSGSTEPPTSFNNQLWYDTGTHTLKLKEEVGSDWISIGYFDQGSGAFSLFDDTKLVDTSGNQTGLLGDQLTTTWEGGTGIVQSLVSPANVKAAIDALVPTTSTTAGDVGTYAALYPTTGASRLQGATLAGSSLRYANFFAYGGSGYANVAPAGTWQLMGATGFYNGSALNQGDKQSSIWLRIS
tara:strand:+ start:5460 stop:6101 length:642 start_codon:yes stop_codon:yes gene_type:complete